MENTLNGKSSQMHICPVAELECISALPYRAPQVDAFNVTDLLSTKKKVFFKH